MKKLFTIALGLGLLPSLVLASGNHPMAGCGLGYLLLSNKDNSKATQVIGATTNGTFGSQTFGISSGTSGCTEDGAVKLVRETEIFAEINLPSLRNDIAAGHGEFVNAFASLLGASTAKQASLVSFLQGQYAELFPTASTSAAEMLGTLQAKLAVHPELLG